MPASLLPRTDVYGTVFAKFSEITSREREQRLWTMNMQILFLLLSSLLYQQAQAFAVRPWRQPTLVQVQKATLLESFPLPVPRGGALPALPKAVSNAFHILIKKGGPVPLSYSLGANALFFFVLAPQLLNALTLSGFFHAMLLGTILWSTLGISGWSYCVLYLALGQLVTKVRFQDKLDRGLAESRGGRRGPENVWGSAATSAICALLYARRAFGESNLYIIGFCAGLATKLADTFASEIGKAYGKTTFLITNLKRVEPGTEGAISVEGTAAAALGGFLLSLYGYTLGFLDATGVAISTVSAFVATNLESLIGATLQTEDNGWMTNEVVNFINTVLGGGIAMALARYVFKIV